MRGLLWTSSPFLIQLGTFLLFYAVQEPANMALFEATLVIVMLFALIGDLGLGTALVQFREAEDRHFVSAFWVNLVWGLLLAGSLVAAAPLIAHWQLPEESAAFEQILRWLCAIIPLASVSGLLRARLQRDLRFPAMSFAEVVSVVTFSAISLLLRPAYGIWGLVAGSIARELSLLISLWVSAALRPRLYFSMAAICEIRSFAVNFTGERIVGFLNSRLSNFLVLPALGPAAAYFYFVNRCTLIPLVRLSTILHRVCLPAFSSVQSDDEQLARGYVKTIQGVALLGWPALMGMLVYAPDIVRLVNPDLQPAITPLRLLSMAVVLKIVGAVGGGIFLAKGKATWSFRWALFSLAILVPSMIIGLEHGINGVAWAILLTSVLFFALSQVLVHRLIRFELGSFLAALGRPAVVSFCTGGVLLFVRQLAETSWLMMLLLELFGAESSRVGAATSLAQGLIVGVVAAATAMRLFAWKASREYWRSLRGASPAVE